MTTENPANSNQTQRVADLVAAAEVGIQDIQAGRFVKIDNKKELDNHFDQIAQHAISKAGESHAA